MSVTEGTDIFHIPTGYFVADGRWCSFAIDYVKYTRILRLPFGLRGGLRHDGHHCQRFVAWLRHIMLWGTK